MSVVIDGLKNHTTHEAKDFAVSRIIDEAQREGTFLSELERKIKPQLNAPHNLLCIFVSALFHEELGPRLAVQSPNNDQCSRTAWTCLSMSSRALFNTLSIPSVYADFFAHRCQQTLWPCQWTQKRRYFEACD